MLIVSIIWSKSYAKLKNISYIELAASEEDERYRYLLKHGKLHHIEADSFSLYVELPQIPNILIIYRRPKERTQNPEKIQLDSRGLKHIPLLEGEERIK